MARLNFENILANFPKRNDIWNVYIDLEIKYTQDIFQIRNLFEKVLALNPKLKMAKNLFEKYLNFEK